MPWCDTCAKFWNPNSLPASGACPTCGRVLSGRTVDVDDPDAVGEDEEYHAPWHFKLMIALAVVYLTWRLIQVVGWFV